MSREIWGVELWRRCSTEGQRGTCSRRAGEKIPIDEVLRRASAPALAPRGTLVRSGGNPDGYRAPRTSASTIAHPHASDGFKIDSAPFLPHKFSFCWSNLLMSILL